MQEFMKQARKTKLADDSLELCKAYEETFDREYLSDKTVLELRVSPAR